MTIVKVHENFKIFLIWGDQKKQENLVLFNKCVHLNFQRVINSKEKMIVYRDDL